MAQQDLSQLQQAYDQDPDFQALFAKWRNAPAYLAPQFAAELDQLGKQKGGIFSQPLPPHYGFGADGKIHQDAWLNRHGDQLGIALAAGGIGGSYLMGLGGAPGAGAATGGAAGGSGAASGGGAAASGGALSSTQIGTGLGTLPNVSPAVDFAAGTTTAPAIGGAGTNIFNALKKYGGPIGGAILGGVQNSRQQAREDAAQNGRAIAENNAAKVAAARYNLDLPNTRTSQVARGEVLNTMHNAPLTGDPRIDKFSGGGLRPDAFGPMSRQAGQTLADTAMNGLQHPETDRLVPQEIPMVGSSKTDNILAGLGTGLSIFSLLDKFGKPTQGTTMPRQPIQVPPYDPYKMEPF